MPVSSLTPRAGDEPPATPEVISSITTQLHECIAETSTAIGLVNQETKCLSFNAQIEATRAGEAGRTFGVVGAEMVVLSRKTADIAQSLSSKSAPLVNKLASISRRLAVEVRGTRLSDLALANIDVVDRNLYERSCDCRWWATDQAAVQALTSPTPATLKFASQRMGVILKAYTVYFDIVLADLEGNIVANGRPTEFRVVGTNHAGSEWFTSAMNTKSGDEYGFQSAHASRLANNQRVLIYSCKVCRGGEASAEPLGVLGVVFRWDALGETIVRNTPIEAAQSSKTRVCIVDSVGLVLADTAGRTLKENLKIPGLDALRQSKKTFSEAEINGRKVLIGFANSPGFETYKTGWYSVIMQDLE